MGLSEAEIKVHDSYTKQKKCSIDLKKVQNLN
jgi:hypothetical protein